MEIKAEGLYLKITPQSKVDDEDWVRVNVTVRVSGFEGQFVSWLQLNDVSRFNDEIINIDKNLGKVSTARLYSAEPDIDIRLKSDNLGGIYGEYTLESERRDGVPTVLSGAFIMDQSYLPSLNRGLQELQRQLST